MANMMDQWVEAARNVGFYEYILPFVLVFAIVYGILERINLFGNSSDDNGSDVAQRVHVIISFALAFFVIAFTPAATTMSAFFINFSGVLALILVSILGAMIVFGLVFRNSDEDDTAGGWFTDNWYTLMIVLAVVAGGLLYVGLGQFPGLPSVDAGLPAMTTSEIIGVVIIGATLLFLGWAVGMDIPGFGDD